MDENKLSKGVLGGTVCIRIQWVWAQPLHYVFIADVMNYHKLSELEQHLLFQSFDIRIPSAVWLNWLYCLDSQVRISVSAWLLSFWGGWVWGWSSCRFLAESVSCSYGPCLFVPKSLSHVRLFATPWTVAYQALPSMGFSRQEYWSVLPFPSPGDLPNPGIEPGSPALQADALPSEPPGKPESQPGASINPLVDMLHSPLHSQTSKTSSFSHFKSPRLCLLLYLSPASSRRAFSVFKDSPWLD